MIGGVVPMVWMVTGTVLTSRFDNRGAQLVGGAMLTVAAIAMSTPALADQQVAGEDNARIECVVSQKDLTRISLVSDEFASVSKMQAENPLDDFSVVNEQTRGDIYLSVPNGFRPKSLSFFGTSKKGFVYKFACRVEPIEAQQIFLSNPAALTPTKEAVAEEGDQQAPDVDESAVRLIQGMAGQGVIPGYRLERPVLVPVRSGNLSVQLIAQYRGLDVTGRVIRIENFGTAPVELSEAQVAPGDALAVSIANPKLGARQITTAYVVIRREGARP